MAAEAFRPLAYTTHPRGLSAQLRNCRRAHPASVKGRCVATVQGSTGEQHAPTEQSVDVIERSVLGAPEDRP
jgi:hypothetical protein